MDYGIFNVRTDVSGCDFIQGCTFTVRVSALKVILGDAAPGNRTYVSGVTVRRSFSRVTSPSLPKVTAFVCAWRGERVLFCVEVFTPPYINFQSFVLSYFRENRLLTKDHCSSTTTFWFFRIFVKTGFLTKDHCSSKTTFWFFRIFVKTGS